MTVKVMLPDPLPGRRAAAVAEVNAKFADMAARLGFLERTHARKRQIAQSVMDGLVLDDDHPFVAEARLRGLPPEEFARDVVYKPDVITAADRRELRRQAILLKLDGAKTPGEVAEIMHEHFPPEDVFPKA